MFLFMVVRIWLSRVCVKQVVVNLNTAGDGIHFRRAGPRDKVISLSLSRVSLPKKLNSGVQRGKVGS